MSQPQQQNSSAKVPLFSYASLAIVAAALIVGIGLGVGLTTSVNASPTNVASS